MNVFGEENRDLIGKVLRIANNDIDDRLRNSDFIIFLENVVAADFEKESEDEGHALKRKSRMRTARERQAFFAAKYGDKEAKNTVTADLINVLQTANKYSLSRIEWLEDLHKDRE